MLNVHWKRKTNEREISVRRWYKTLTYLVILLLFFFLCRKEHVKSRFFLCGGSRYVCAESRKRYSEGKRRNVTLGLINAVRVLQLNCRDKSPNAGIQSQTGKKNVHTCICTYVHCICLLSLGRTVKTFYAIVFLAYTYRLNTSLIHV